MSGIAMIIGIIIGFALAVGIVGNLVNRSNNKGDSKATFLHFSNQSLDVTLRVDGQKKPIDINKYILDSK